MLFLITRKNAIMKLNIPDKIFDWICLFKRIIPFYPRKKEKKKNKIYFTQKNINDINHDPILKKIKMIINWKKMLRNPTQKNLRYQNNFPCLNFGRIFVKKYSNFFNFLEKSEEIFFFNFLLSHQLLNENLFLRKNENTLFYFLNFITNLKFLVQIKSLFNLKEFFQIELEYLGKKFFLIFPKKKFFNSNLFKKKKTILPFAEINTAMFNLISNKLENINKIGIYKKINKIFKIELFSKISFRIKFFIQNMEIFSQKKIKNFSIEHTYKFKKIKFKKNINLLKRTYLIFSKNFDFPFLKINSIEGNFFFENFSINHFFLFFLFFLENNFSVLKNEKRINFYFLEKFYQKRSFISTYLDLDWIFDSINSKIFLPGNFYSLKNYYKKKLNVLFSKFKKKKITSNEIFRQKIKNKKKNIAEKFKKNNILFYFGKIEKKIYVNNLKKLLFVKNQEMICCIKFDLVI